MADNHDQKVKADATQTTLEQFLVACQKSLARSIQNAQQMGKSDSEFAQGERPVYVIDEVAFDLNAGVHIDPQLEGRLGERVILDFDAPGEQRSQLRFTVTTKPVELIVGAKLELANLDPLGETLPNSRLRTWLVDDHGVPVANYPVNLHFARAGEKRLKKPITIPTDSVGRIDFKINIQTNKVKVVGIRKAFDVYLQGAVEEYFVWVTAARKSEWESVVEPAAPHPPRAIHRDSEGHPLELCSELLRLRIR